MAPVMSPWAVPVLSSALPENVYVADAGGPALIVPVPTLTSRTQWLLVPGPSVDTTVTVPQTSPTHVLLGSSLTTVATHKVFVVDTTAAFGNYDPSGRIFHKLFQRETGCAEVAYLQVEPTNSWNGQQCRYPRNIHTDSIHFPLKSVYGPAFYVLMPPATF